MVNGIDGNLPGMTGVGALSPQSPATAAGGAASSTSFSDVLQKSIDEVEKMEQDASKAVEDLATGKTDDLTGVMTALAKSDLAFKTLLTIRAKLMDAYDEIKNIPI